MTPLDEVLARRHLPALDGLRAVAVGIVIIYHAGYDRVSGDLGVTAFFVLSGFLITWLLLKEEDKNGTISLRSFYLRRSLRIFPAYFVFVAISFALDLALGDPWDLKSVVSAVTYTINYRNAFFGHDGPIPHAWSLAVEEQFYLVWPVLLIALMRSRKLLSGLIGIILGVCAWRSLLYVGLGVPNHYVYNAFDTRFDSLAIGCLLAVMTRIPAFVNVSRRLGAKAVYPIPVILLIYVSRDLIGPTWHNTLGYTVDSALFAILIVQLMQLSAEPGWRWLDSRLAVWIGALSYPLYLWHIWGLSMADNLTRSDGRSVNFIVGVVLSFALASLSYYGFEKHFLKLKGRLSQSVSTGVALTCEISVTGIDD
jgi:peptidoglycan/LPS O-acetylase OafA/YrhL